MRQHTCRLLLLTLLTATSHYHAQASICLGRHFTCAILGTNEIKCWGESTKGALGLANLTQIGAAPGEMGVNLPAVNIGTNRNPSKISCGDDHVCALLSSGAVTCWGDGSNGTLGQGSTENIGDDPGEMGDDLPVVDLGSNGTVKAKDICSSKGYSCAVLHGGNVKCWGSNAFGNLGIGSTENIGDEPGEMGDDLPEVDLGAGKSATHVACGVDHACALLTSNEVKCWGRNGPEGVLGIGSTQDFFGAEPGQMGDLLNPVALGSVGRVTQISAGFRFSCALFDNLEVKCWGDGSKGKLGYQDDENIGAVSSALGNDLPTIDFGANLGVLQMSSKSEHSCVMTDKNDVKCWGKRGALGASADPGNVGDEVDEMGDNLLTVDLGTTFKVLQVATGEFHSCTVLATRELKCWGSNDKGQLGLGNTFGAGDGAGLMGNFLNELDLGGLVREPQSPPTTSPVVATPSISQPVPTFSPSSSLAPVPAPSGSSSRKELPTILLAFLHFIISAWMQ